MAKRKDNDFKIILNGIDGRQLLLQRYFNFNPFTEDKQENVKEEDMVNFLHEKDKKKRRGMYFLDPQRGTVKIWAVMIDFTINGPLPVSTKKPCWSCRSKFTTNPIGCPVKYNPTPKNPVQIARLMERFKEMNHVVDKNNLDFFETEGIFCSFPCVKYYILEQLAKTKSVKYKKALEYLSLLYYKFTGEMLIIQPSPSWNLTVDWGGHLTPSEYRASIGNLEYTETVNVLRPYMFCSSNWIREKKIKL